jgi:hypothetical protein
MVVLVVVHTAKQQHRPGEPVDIGSLPAVGGHDD